MKINTVHFITIEAKNAGQRVDNFIRSRYPNLPKSRIYQMLRKGEARINKKRAKPETRLAAGDEIRLPPIILTPETPRQIPDFWRENIRAAVLFENDHFLILNKPAGIAVHGGSGQNFGVIDVVYSLWGDRYAELAHRLDRDTSGVLVLGKTRAALAAFQEKMKHDQVEKKYLCLVDGAWPENIHRAEIALQKGQTQGGERMVVVRSGGQKACTEFEILQSFPRTTLLAATLKTGRTHQIRVSAQHVGCAILGDDKYGQREANRAAKKCGLKGLFLHAQDIIFSYEGCQIHAHAPLPREHRDFLTKIE